MGSFIEKVQTHANQGDYTQLVNALGEMLLAFVILVGAGVLLVIDKGDNAILAICSAAIGAIISYYFRPKNGGN